MTFPVTYDEVVEDVPELPEVETLRRGLERSVVGRRIHQVIVADDRVLKGQTPETLQERTVGLTITEVRRRGKYLLLQLGANSTSSDTINFATLSGPSPALVCIHLKMRGQLLVEDATLPAGRYHCVTLLLDDGATALRFYDMWTWGELRAITTSEVETLVPGLAELGPEPLEPNWNGAVLRQSLARRKQAIKPTLLDQTVVAGVGNIYADESLFRARIHPKHPAGTLSEVEADKLAGAVRSVLTEAVAGGGTMSEDYVDVDGVAGRFVPSVYDRGGKPCKVCEAILIRIKLGGRGTVYCPICQPGDF